MEPGSTWWITADSTNYSRRPQKSFLISHLMTPLASEACFQKLMSFAFPISITVHLSHIRQHHGPRLSSNHFITAANIIPEFNFNTKKCFIHLTLLGFSTSNSYSGFPRRFFLWLCMSASTNFFCAHRWGIAHNNLRMVHGIPVHLVRGRLLCWKLLILEGFRGLDSCSKICWRMKCLNTEMTYCFYWT